jgi:hypothetical protein
MFVPSGFFAENKEAVTVIESVATDAWYESVATTDVAVAVSPVSCDAVAAETEKSTALAVAFEGTTERAPKPKAATVTSAMRLKVVFVDICFLSIVDPRTIRGSAWNKRTCSSRFIARADESNSPPCIRTRRRKLGR